MSKYKQQVNLEIVRRGLVSVMNNTKWNELRDSVCCELSFTPPYQIKLVLEPSPYPEHFESDVWYLGDWSDECLKPFYAIEYLRIRPRYLRHRGQLIEPEVENIEPDLLNILHRHHIPYQKKGDTIMIYGYASQTGIISKGSKL